MFHYGGNSNNRERDFYPLMGQDPAAGQQTWVQTPTHVSSEERMPLQPMNETPTPWCQISREDPACQKPHRSDNALSGSNANYPQAQAYKQQEYLLNGNCSKQRLLRNTPYLDGNGKESDLVTNQEEEETNILPTILECRSLASTHNINEKNGSADEYVNILNDILDIIPDDFEYGSSFSFVLHEKTSGKEIRVICDPPKSNNQPAVSSKTSHGAKHGDGMPLNLSTSLQTQAEKNCKMIATHFAKKPKKDHGFNLPSNSINPNIQHSFRRYSNDSSHRQLFDIQSGSKDASVQKKVINKPTLHRREKSGIYRPSSKKRLNEVQGTSDLTTPVLIPKDDSYILFNNNTTLADRGYSHPNRLPQHLNSEPEGLPFRMENKRHAASVFSNIVRQQVTNNSLIQGSRDINCIGGVTTVVQSQREKNALELSSSSVPTPLNSKKGLSKISCIPPVGSQNRNTSTSHRLQSSSNSISSGPSQVLDNIYTTILRHMLSENTDYVGPRRQREKNHPEFERTQNNGSNVSIDQRKIVPEFRKQPGSSYSDAQNGLLKNLLFSNEVHLPNRPQLIPTEQGTEMTPNNQVTTKDACNTGSVRYNPTSQSNPCHHEEISNSSNFVQIETPPTQAIRITSPGQSVERRSSNNMYPTYAPPDFHLQSVQKSYDVGKSDQQPGVVKSKKATKKVAVAKDSVVGIFPAAPDTGNNFAKKLKNQIKNKILLSKGYYLAYGVKLKKCNVVVERLVLKALTSNNVTRPLYPDPITDARTDKEELSAEVNKQQCVSILKSSPAKRNVKRSPYVRKGVRKISLRYCATCNIMDNVKNMWAKGGTHNYQCHLCVTKSYIASLDSNSQFLRTKLVQALLLESTSDEEWTSNDG